MTFDEPIKAAKRRKTSFSLKFCPRCGSTNVFWAQGLPQLWSLWQCKDCGYHGALILENGNLSAKLRHDWKNKTSGF